jgi:uncharacterized protein YoxC
VSKITVALSVVIIVLLLTITSIGFIGVTNTNELQTRYDKLESDFQGLTTNYNNLQSQYQHLSETQTADQNSQINNLQSRVNSLNGEISSLQTQLANATALISKLQGPTGILPTYMDLSYNGPVMSGGYYFLQLTVKNTGTLPITQIYVTINSQQVTIPFNYLDSVVSSSSPLPSYQTATGSKNVTPPINNAGTYPLVIQALTNNGTIYTYQTTIKTNNA